MNEVKKTKNRYITGFDGLRAFGVLGVILYHLNPNVFVGGYLGVPIFLAVSGYLVTDHMLYSYQTRGSYDNKGFYLRRIKKIYPQMITVLLATSAYILLFQKELLVKLYQVVATNLLNVYNWWQIANGQSYFERFAGNESPFTHMWTLSIEGQFYIVWPLIIWLLYRYVKSKKGKFFVMIGLAAISAVLMAVLFKPGVDTSRIYYGTDTRLYSIMFGAALAVIWPTHDLREKIPSTAKVFLNLIGTIASALMLYLVFSPIMDPQRPFPYQGGMVIFSILTMILIAVVAHPGASFNKLLTNPVFTWIGQRSYGIYLYQFPVMIIFEHLVKNTRDHPVIYGIIQIALILAISELTYRIIEKPFGKITWRKTKAVLASAFDFKNGDWKTKTYLVIGTIIAVLGMSAIVVSPSAKAQKADESPLAKQIAKNKAKNEAKNKELIKKAKERSKNKESEQPVDKSTALKEAEQAAKTNPVNQEFEAYGISQTDLQLAQKMDITAVGDSVMAGSSNNLTQIFPNMIIDATVSRQLINTFGTVESLKSQGALNKIVLMGLGTNGPFTQDDFDEMMNTIGSDKTVFWVNVSVPRTWQDQVNNLLAENTKKYSNLHVIDWKNFIAGHPDWLYDDQTHPTPDGSKYYSAFIAKQIIENTDF